MSIYNKLDQVLGVYAVILIPVGTILNIISIIVCLRVKSNNTFIFMAFFSFFNIFTVSWWNLNNFIKVFTGIDLLNSGLWPCKIGNFLQFTSLQTAAWFLVN
jgi:hypothetical protein